MTLAEFLNQVQGGLPVWGWCLIALCFCATCMSRT
jgi:hypothetical protein